MNPANFTNNMPVDYEHVRQIKQFVKELDKGFEDYIHFLNEYDKAISERRFYAAGVIESKLSALSKENKKIDKHILELTT